MKEKIILVVITIISLLALVAITITPLTLAQETFALAENCSDNNNCWCYESGTELFCFNNKDECSKRQMSDISGVSGCSKR